MVKLNKIYTRTGDGGTTGLVDGSRVGKELPLLAAIGDVDEVNSALGLALADSNAPDDIVEKLQRIQNDLFDLGADIATPVDTETGFEESSNAQPAALRVTATQVTRLEQELDSYNADLAPLTSFILPGGSVASARLHLARAICRRAERSLAKAVAKGAQINPHTQAYLNRLSDYLFVLCRWLNARGKADILWQPGATR